MAIGVNFNGTVYQPLDISELLDLPQSKLYQPFAMENVSNETGSGADYRPCAYWSMYVSNYPEGFSSKLISYYQNGDAIHRYTNVSISPPVFDLYNFYIQGLSSRIYFTRFHIENNSTVLSMFNDRGSGTITYEFSNRYDDGMALITVYGKSSDGSKEFIGFGAISKRTERGVTTYSLRNCYGFYKYDNQWKTDAGVTIEPKDESGENVDNDGKTQGGVKDGTRTRATLTLPTLPNIDTSLLGYNLYQLSNNEVGQFVEYLWSDDFITNIKKLYSDPMESVVGLYVADFSPVTLGANTVVVGNCDTNVSANICSQFAHITCGGIDVIEEYGTYCDYTPFVDVKMYLPKVGIVPLDTDTVMHNTIYVDYYVEMSSGQGVCFVRLLNKRSEDLTILATYPCQCMTRLPLSAKDSSERYSAFIGAVSSTVVNGVMGNGVGVAMSMLNGAENMLSSKNHYVNTGSICDMGSLMNYKKPYLIVNYHSVVKPSQYNKYVGYKNPVRATLSSKSGYTVIDEVFIDFEVPNKVKERIKTKLQNGVVL